MNRSLKEKLAARDVQEQCTEAAVLVPANRILRTRDTRHRREPRPKPAKPI